MRSEEIPWDWFHSAVESSKFQSKCYVTFSECNRCFIFCFCHIGKSLVQRIHLLPPASCLYHLLCLEKSHMKCYWENKRVLPSPQLLKLKSCPWSHFIYCPRPHIFKPSTSSVCSVFWISHIYPFPMPSLQPPCPKISSLSWTVTALLNWAGLDCCFHCHFSMSHFYAVARGLFLKYKSDCYFCLKHSSKIT